MIRVRRGDEPQALRDARAVELPRVRAIAAQRRLTEEDIGKRYQVAKKALWKAQGFKCAYCEAREQLKRNDAEHARPKGRADRRPGSLADHGYWWLAWTWHNLFFACRNCNQPPAKYDQFPVAVGSTALVAEHEPPGDERPLLLDPAEDDGIAHIRFEHTPRPDGSIQWIARPRDGSERGRVTIDVCKLDAPDQLTLYASHVQENVDPERDVIRAAIDDGDPAAVWEAWECALLRLLSPTQPYTALSYDALDFYFPIAERVRWDLSLRKPTWESH